VIYATVASGSVIENAESAAARQRTLSELWRGIELENRVGRHLGAAAIRVVVDGDRDIAGLFEENEFSLESPVVGAAV
jgi:hypothetical protein